MLKNVRGVNFRMKKYFNRYPRKFFLLCIVFEVLLFNIGFMSSIRYFKINFVVQNAFGVCAEMVNFSDFRIFFCDFFSYIGQ